MNGGVLSVDLLVSAIVPAYGRPEKLRKAIRSLLAQDLDPSQFEVIVVDSSPDDSNLAVVAGLQQEARCPLRCYTKPPEGPGPSRNLGAWAARGRFLAFTDSDCQASTQWLREGVAAFQEGAGLVQGRTIPEPGVPRGPLNAFIWVEEETFLYETANMFYRREAFEQAGGFPSDMHAHRQKPMGGEDVDLAWKVKRAGWESRFAANALVIHEVLPITLWRWLFNKHLYIFPRFLHDYPELRRFFFARYFFDKVHAWLVLALVGFALAALALPALLLALPYIITRASEPTRTFRSALRVLRVLAYLLRDLASLGILLAGSARYRALLL